MPKYSTIIFDMDGVVVDSEKVYMAADFEFLKRHQIPYNNEEIKDMLVGREIKNGTLTMKEAYNIQGDLEELFAERKNLLTESFKNQIEFIPGFFDFYQQVKRIGYKTCIATASGDEFLKLIDQKLHIYELFENHVYGVSKVGNKSKPDPAIFLYAANEIASNPTECIVIEDSPRGIEAANRAGMFCIGLGTSFSLSKLQNANLVVKDYSEIRLGDI